MSNAKQNEGNGDEGSGEDGNLVLPEVTDRSQNKALHQLSWSVEGETVHTLVSKLQHLYIWGTSPRELLSCMLAKAVLQLLVISNLGLDSLKLMGPSVALRWAALGGAGGCMRALVLRVSLTFIAKGTLTVTKNFTAGSESYSTVTIYSAFQSVKWNISLAAVSPIPFKPEPPDIWRSLDPVNRGTDSLQMLPYQMTWIRTMKGRNHKDGVYSPRNHFPSDLNVTYRGWWHNPYLLQQSLLEEKTES